MRWFVEVASSQTEAPEKWVVEATQWQPALQAARSLRGEAAEMSGFSIELLEDGFRAVDPTTFVRYIVRRAPDETPVSSPRSKAPAAREQNGGGSVSPSAGVSGSQLPASKASRIAAMLDLGVSSEAPPASKPPPGLAPDAAEAAVLSASAASEPGAPEAQAEVVEASAPQPAIPSSAPRAPSQAPPPPAPATGASELLPPAELLFQREEDPSPSSPLTYRETVWVVPAGTSSDAAVRLLVGMFEGVRAALAGAKPGKLVNMAIFDHRFQGKPQSPPLATLTWKDWKDKGQGPEIHRPADSPASLQRAAVAAALSTAIPAMAVPAAAAPSPAVAGAVPPMGQALSEPPPRTPMPSVPRVRLSGVELITDLFEAMHDLHFLRDPLEGADFVLALVMEKLPSTVGLVHFYDIDAREFVVVRAVGPGAAKALQIRTSEKDALIAEAMHKRRAVVIDDGTDDPRAQNGRWALIGSCRSLVCAPVEQAGRFLGLLELSNPRDGGPFHETDGHALTYMGEQFAEFLATRGVVLDPDRFGGR